MPWLQLALISPREQVPLIEAVLENAGALAVTLDDPEETDPAQAPADLSLLEPAPGKTPLWTLVRITALFEDSTEASTLAMQCAATLNPILAAQAKIEPLPDQVWERAWLKHWKPRRFGRRLWICPRTQGPACTPADSMTEPTINPTSEPNAAVVAFDPGLAFGTGSHPTTALCLEWLDSLDLAGKTLIDFGCGSGILAIAAVKLGAIRAIAIDHDPQALEATTANAAANDVIGHLSCHTPNAIPTQFADVLVANILAGVLIEIAPTLTRLCAQGARVALSGLLEPQIPSVLAAYRHRITFSEPVIRDQWALLSGQCV